MDEKGWPRPDEWKEYGQQQLKEDIQSGELPPETTFVGYVVHLVEREEFLVKHKSNKEMNAYSWAKSPSFAKVFNRFDKACNAAREHGEADVFAMVDVGPQYLVFIPGY